MEERGREKKRESELLMLEIKPNTLTLHVWFEETLEPLSPAEGTVRKPFVSKTRLVGK